MAHAKTTAAVSLLEREEARGVFTRRIEGANFLVAAARTNMTAPNHLLADGIPTETFNKGVFVAPCASKILGIKVGGVTMPHMANTAVTGGAGNIDFVALGNHILDSGSGLGIFAIGDVLVISGTVTNVGPFTVATVAAGDITTVETIVGELPAGAVTITAIGKCTVDVKKSVIGGTDVSLLSATKQVQTNTVLDCGYAHTGGTVFVDETAAANNDTANDVLVCAAGGPAVDDFFYVGAANKFDGFLIKCTTLGAGFVTTGIWEYWNGTAWTDLQVEEDETDGFDGVTTTGYWKVRWDLTNQTDWTTNDAGFGTIAYHVRYRFITQTTHTTHPLFGQIWIYPYGWKDFVVAAPPSTAVMARGDVVDLPLSTTDGALALLEGQEVYIQVALPNSGAVATLSDGMRVEVEWMPQEV